MSFGFSAGDIAMAIKFTISVTNALNDTRGAAPEYQQAIEHWKQLLVAYQHLQHLHTRCLDPTLLDEIRSLAALAEEPIHDYIKKIHAEFGTAMPTNAGESRLQVSKIFKKAKWALHSSAKDEKLRSQMSARLQTVQIKFEQLNMMGIDRANDEIGQLRQHQVDLAAEQHIFNVTLMKLVTDLSRTMASNDSPSRSMGVGSSNIQAASTIIAKRDTNTSPVTRSPNSSIARRNALNIERAKRVGVGLIRALSYIFQNASQVLRFLYPLLQGLFFFLHRTITDIPRTMAITAVDTIHFEDGLGRTFNLPYQWFHKWQTFQGFILDSFAGKPGERYVTAGQYYLLNAVHSRVISSSDQGWRKAVFPGVKIAMSMIVTETSVQFLECPKCEAVLDYEEEDVIIRCPTVGCWLGYKVDLVAPASQVPLSEGHMHEEPQEHRHRRARRKSLVAPLPPVDSSAHPVTTNGIFNTSITKDLEEELRHFKRVHFRPVPRTYGDFSNGNTTWTETFSQFVETMQRQMSTMGFDASLSSRPSNIAYIENLLDSVADQFINTSTSARQFSRCLPLYAVAIDGLAPYHAKAATVFWDALRIAVFTATVTHRSSSLFTYLSNTLTQIADLLPQTSMANLFWTPAMGQLVAEIYVDIVTFLLQCLRDYSKYVVDQFVILHPKIDRIQSFAATIVVKIGEASRTFDQLASEQRTSQSKAEAKDWVDRREQLKKDIFPYAEEID